MSYATWEYYSGSHTAVQTEQEFTRLSRVAARKIDIFTGQRAAGAAGYKADAVRECECELVDYLHAAEATAQGHHERIERRILRELPGFNAGAAGGESSCCGVCLALRHRTDGGVLMGPLFTDTVTAYHRTREGRADIWTRRELRGVQWRQKTVRTALANEAGKILYAAETTVTIPAPAAPGGLTLAPGDVLVFGACAAEISEEYTEDDLIRGHGAVIVQSVADNTLRPRLRSCASDGGKIHHEVHKRAAEGARADGGGYRPEVRRRRGAAPLRADGAVRQRRAEPKRHDQHPPRLG